MVDWNGTVEAVSKPFRYANGWTLPSVPDWAPGIPSQSCDCAAGELAKKCLDRLPALGKRGDV